MRTFGGFLSDGGRVYGEVRGDEVHLLARPFWLGLEFSGEKRSLGELTIDLPVAPSKVIAVGLNYRDHIKEMQRTEIGSPLIWFKAPSSLLPHEGTIRIAYPEHKTDFETELAIVIGQPAKNVAVERALDYVFGFTIAEDISDRDLQKSEKQFSRAKSFDTYTPVGPFVYTEVDTVGSRDFDRAEWRGSPAGAHQPDDLSGRRDYFFCQPGAHSFTGRFNPDRNAVGSRSDPRGRRISGAYRRLADAAKFRRQRERLSEKSLPRVNLLGFVYIPR